MLGDSYEYPNTGSSLWHNSELYKDPRDAVRAIVAKARDKVTHLGNVVLEAEKAIDW